jgi:enamine deaminase RidA (YjgF/YER057c/UK114 family)
VRGQGVAGVGGREQNRDMEITHLNPESLFTNPAFSQGVLVSGEHRTLHVGGQNGTDSAGEIVGGGLGPQTEQALRNVMTVLAEVGADQSNVVRMAVYVAAGQSVDEGFAASMRVWGQHPTAITVLFVAALGRPDALVEIEATAVM